MLSCEDAMVLTDKIGRIVNCNRSWALLTGHSLTDAEGLDYSILDGSMTDCAEVDRCRSLRKALQSSVSTVINYRKDGLMFMNSVTTSPIRGVYMSEGEKEHSIE
jgi:PAS domain S-box-containing protein